MHPAVVHADLDTCDALRHREAVSKPKPLFEPPALDAIFHEEVVKRFAHEALPGEHPILAMGRVARNKNAVIIPLRPTAKKMGFFHRRKARKVAEAIPETKLPDFGPTFAAAMHAADLWSAEDDAELAWPRVTRALTDGRAPLVALVHAHRAPPLLARLATTRRRAPCVPPPSPDLG